MGGGCGRPTHALHSSSQSSRSPPPRPCLLMVWSMRKNRRGPCVLTVEEHGLQPLAGRAGRLVQLQGEERQCLPG